jgi:Rad3-related DNA helicase
MSILSFFPYPTIRPGQATALEWIERNWSRYDVFCLSAPVAAGKSAIAYTIAKWCEYLGQSTTIATPTNVLVSQYKMDHKLPTLRLRRQYATGDHFENARKKFNSEPTKLCNYYSLLANKSYGDVQIFDEAHQLVPMLTDFQGIKLWQSQCGWPNTIRTVFDVLMWAAGRGDTLGRKVEKLVLGNPDDFVVQIEDDLYRGKLDKCLRIYPLTPKHNRPILWPPSRVKKLVLMSATIAKPDVVDLGLADRRVGFLNVPSDIPVDNRPLFYKPVGPMGRDHWPKYIDDVIDVIRDAYTRYDRVFVHTTYSLANRMETIVGRGIDEFIVHNAANKQRLLSEWMAHREPSAFIGAGLSEGLNLRGDICEHQIITKCLWPDLAQPAIAAKAKQSPEWYAWSTIKTLAQSYGRICRGPNDFGATLLTDESFNVILQQWSHLLPDWFKESFIMENT